MLARNERSLGVVPPVGWSSAKTGAGGFVRGLDIASDGTMVCRTDGFGAYYYNPSLALWQQIITRASMPGSSVGPNADFHSTTSGVYDFRIAPSNTNIAYMVFDGLIFKTTNLKSGCTWSQTNFSQFDQSAGNVNDGYGAMGPKLAIDPANASVVYAGTPKGGVFVTTDGGTTWAAIAAVGTSSSVSGVFPGHLVCFDPSSAVTGGKTQGIYISTYGTGVYHTTNASTFTLTTGTPTTHDHMVCDQSGNLWLTDNTSGGPGGNLKKFASGSWSTSLSAATFGDGVSVIAIDPNNVSKIIVLAQSGNYSASSNGGGAWTARQVHTLTATDIPWLSLSGSFMTIGDIRFDQNSLLHVSSGVGTWTWTPDYAGGVNAYTSLSVGIEQLVAFDVMSPPAGVPSFLSQDRAQWYYGSPSAYPSGYGPDPTYTNAIAPGWNADWATGAAATVVMISNGNVVGSIANSGFSTDGGQTWTLFGGLSPGGVHNSNLPSESSANGGCIAAGSASNFVAVLANNGGVYFTTNTGASWTAATFPGGILNTNAGFFNQQSQNAIRRKIVAADRTNQNTFYIFNDANGVYKSTNSGTTWTQVNATAFLFGTSGFSSVMKAAPKLGSTSTLGHLFFTDGPLSGTHPQVQSFWWSTDGGATWTAVPNVADVWCYGFGACAPGHTYPAIYIYGWVSGVEGVWQCVDFNTSTGAGTWTNLGLPTYTADTPVAMEGDANTFGTLYVGLQGSGWARYN